MKTHLLLPLLSLAFVCQPATAEIITFDFEGAAGDPLVGQSTASTTASSGGITLTLTATVHGGDGKFHRTDSGGFGINADLTGDVTTEFDSGVFTEAMDFTLSSNVPLSSLTLVSIKFEDFTDGDAGTITKNLALFGDLGFFEDSNLSLTNVLTFTFDTPGQIGQAEIIGSDTLRLSQARGSFGLETFVFNAEAASVPEPNSAALLALGGFVWFRHRSQKAKAIQ